MVKKTEHKDYGIKMGTPNQVIWESVKRESKILIEQSEKNLVIQRAVLELAESKIAEEIEKFK